MLPASPDYSTFPNLNSVAGQTKKLTDRSSKRQGLIILCDEVIERIVQPGKWAFAYGTICSIVLAIGVVEFIQLNNKPLYIQIVNSSTRIVGILCAVHIPN